jgi:hypothetical protein
MVDDESAFPDDNEGINDGCDIPVDVVQSVVMSEDIVAKNRFVLDGEGNIIRTGIAEDVEEIIELEELEVVKSTELGHGDCAKTSSRKYRAD